MEVNFVKKFMIAFLTLFLASLIILSCFSASVPAQRFEGNDANNYTPPEGCIYYKFPDLSEGETGTFSQKFNEQGEVDPSGSLEFSYTIADSGNGYTQVSVWTSNFPIFDVIVKGGNANNLIDY